MRSDLFEGYDRLSVQQLASLLVVIALIGALGGGVAVGGASGDAGIPADAFGQMDIDPDDVLIQVSVGSDGDAVWEIQYRVRLATDDEEQAFEELRDDIDADPDAYTDRFRERMVATAEAAETATGREMEITETTVTAERRELPQSYGVITYQFRWSGFAAVDDERLVIGDAIDGLFLDEASSLIVSWPEEYGLVDASPSPTETRDGAVVWAGPVDFTGGEPRVTVEPGADATGLSSVVLVGLLVVVGGMAAYAWRSRRANRPDEGSDATAPATDELTESSQATESPVPAGEADSPSDDADPVPTQADETLLSNEEQVLQLVESSGGRMKQKRVAEELDWTAAKTSQVVTELRDDDALDGFRLGRENVLSLPDYEMETDEKHDTGDEETGDRET